MPHRRMYASNTYIRFADYMKYSVGTDNLAFSEVRLSDLHCNHYQGYTHD